MSQPAFIEFRPYGDPKRLEWLLVQAAAFNAGARGDARNTDVTPATIAKPTSSRSPSFTEPSSASSDAVSDGLLLLVGFAIVAGATSVFRAAPRPLL